MEKPSTPMWDHGANKWYYNGKFYDDPHQAEFLYANDLLKYIDFLHEKIEKLEEEIKNYPGPAFCASAE
jgi:hypothetical protein